MIKLIIFLAFISSPAPNYPLICDTGVDCASMCQEFKNGAECQESVADNMDEICWCSVIEHSWVYCGCLQPKLMSKDEWIEYLIYKGRKNQIDI